MTIIEKLDKLDRRIIFLLMGLAVFIPILLRVVISVPSSPIVESIYNKIEKIPENSVVLLSFDFDPSTSAELLPMAEAIVDHCFRKNLKIVAMAFWPQGPQIANRVLLDKAAKYNKAYGEDYINLGYKVGGPVTIDSMGNSIRASFPTDGDNKSLDNFPFMKRVNKLADLALIVSFSAGDPGIKQWAMLGSDRYKVPVTGGVTAVTAPEIMPMANSGQLIGFMGGLRGAAEYETLIQLPGYASRAMSAQTWAHMVIIMLIIIGNVTMFLVKKQKAK